jgi:hypothetical protein
VIEGIAMPTNVRITFDNNDKIALLRLYGQEIILADIPLDVTVFYLNPRSTADTAIEFLPPYYVTLADDTQIYFVPAPMGHRFLRGLYIYDGERWVIEGRTDVKLLGETEFVEYRSITIRPDWGEFITGERFE